MLCMWWREKETFLLFWMSLLDILYYVYFTILQCTFATFIQRGSGNQARDSNAMPFGAGTERRVTFFSFECLWSAMNLLSYYCLFVKLLHTSYHHSSYIYIHISFPARSKMPTLGPPLHWTPPPPPWLYWTPSTFFDPHGVDSPLPTWPDVRTLMDDVSHSHCFSSYDPFQDDLAMFAYIPNHQYHHYH